MSPVHIIITSQFSNIYFNATVDTSFNRAVCSSYYKASNGWMSNESEVMRKKWDMAYFKALFQFAWTDWENLNQLW